MTDRSEIDPGLPAWKSQPATLPHGQFRTRAEAWRQTLIALTLVATVNVQAQDNDSIKTEKWQCFDEFDYKETVLVQLEHVAYVEGDGKSSGFGEVSVAGTTYPASFQVAGFDRRWNFGEKMNYSFIIAPDGDGLYYDFTNVEVGDTTKPRDLFKCVLSRPSQAHELKLPNKKK